MKNCLDNICLNLSKDRYTSFVIESKISDHNSQCISIFNKDENIEILYTKLRFTNNPEKINHFCSLLSTEKWEEMNLEKKFKIFINILNYYLDLAFALMKRRRTKMVNMEN